MERYYVDKALTNVALARKRPTFLAERLFPVVNHADLTGSYWKTDPNMASAITQNTERAPSASPHSLYEEPPVQEDFKIKDHSLQTSLADEYRRRDPAIEREGDKVTKLVDALDLVKEVNCIKILEANLTTADELDDGNKFDDVDSSDPLEYILSFYDAIEAAIGAPPNTLALDAKVARAIINHKLVKERGLPTMGPDRYNIGIRNMETLLAQFLSLDNVMIAVGSIRNIARKAETKNITRTWGDNMVLGYTENPSLEYAGMGLTIKWDPPAEDGEDVIQGKLVERERLAGFRRSWGFAVHDYYTLELVNPLAGVWIPDVLK